MKLFQLKKRLSQLNAKLRLFVKWGVSRLKKYDVIHKILKLEEKIERLEQANVPAKQEKQATKNDFSKKPNQKMFKALFAKFESSSVSIPAFCEDEENPSKISINFQSGAISIINYYQLPSDYYRQNYRRKFKNPEVSAQLHALYAAIGVTLLKL
jgi:hypothetical protein